MKSVLLFYCIVFALVIALAAVVIVAVRQAGAQKMAEAQYEAKARVQAQEQQKLEARLKVAEELVAKHQAETEARLKAEEQARAAADAKAKMDNEAKAKNDAALALIAKATKAQPWVNSLGMKFLPVAGTAVLFSVWDTRVQDYQAFVKATGRKWEKPSFPQGPTHPAVMVSWEDAQAFCLWLTEIELQGGKLPTGLSYRLPRDWEWSVAVGLKEPKEGTPAAKHPGKKELRIIGGSAITNTTYDTTMGYPWGRQWPPPRETGNFGTFSVYVPGTSGFGPDERKSVTVDDFAYTSPVTSFVPNVFGLFDIGGNVLQWCEDWQSADQTERVRRGGDWASYSRDELLSAYRSPARSGYRNSASGFRVVLVSSGGVR